MEMKPENPIKETGKDLFLSGERENERIPLEITYVEPGMAGPSNVRKVPRGGLCSLAHYNRLRICPAPPQEKMDIKRKKSTIFETLESGGFF